MLDVYLEFSALPPAAFTAWLQTCNELAAAVARGPRLIALVGAEGSGKTFTLKAVAASLAASRARVRAPGDPIAAGITVDLLDGLGQDAALALAGEPDFAGVRVVALRPEAVGQLLQRHSDTRLVHMRAMSDRDVRQMVGSRQAFHELPQDAFAPGALAALSRLCNGNPARLDRLIDRAMRHRNGAQIGATDIERADHDLSPTLPLSPSLPLSTSASAWDLLHAPVDPARQARSELLARQRVLRRQAGGAVAGIAIAAAVSWGLTILPQAFEQAAAATANRFARYLDDMDRKPGRPGALPPSLQRGDPATESVSGPPKPK